MLSCIKSVLFVMVNAKQIDFFYRNNFYMQTCACISQRSLTGSEVLHFFFVVLLSVIMLALWSWHVFWVPLWSFIV